MLGGVALDFCEASRNNFCNRCYINQIQFNRFSLKVLLDLKCAGRWCLEKILPSFSDTLAKNGIIIFFFLLLLDAMGFFPQNFFADLTDTCHFEVLSFDVFPVPFPFPLDTQGPLGLLGSSV